MRYRLRTLLIVLAIGPPATGAVWAFGDRSAAHRMPELLLIVGALLVFLSALYPLTLAAAWTVDSTAAMFSDRDKR